MFALVFGFMQAQTKTEAETKATESDTRLREADTLRQAEIDKRLEITKVVGFAGEAAGASTDPAAVNRALEEAKATFSASGKQAKNLQQALAAGITDYNGLLAQNRDLTQQVEQLRNDLSSRQREFATALTEKDGTISQVRSELEDTRNSTNTQIVDLERQRDALREQVREGEQQISALRTQMDDAVRTASSENQRLLQRNNILSERVSSVERQQASPDGSVLTVSVELGRAWIDRGRLDRIRPGMQFEIRGASSGRTKGSVRVNSVEDRRSQVEILSQADPFDPISPDDAIYNDLYDPGRTPVAALLGNGFGKMSSEEMKNMLTQVGIRVEPEVTAETDYLILGTPFFDPDTGELIPWASQEPYKAAESLSVQIVPYRDATAWLGL
ncbi:MAG: hypothetical protein EYC70_03295 [Planctomycetota bacterium]|nr:MAG: hypothetical protein EYC70_03295 [Planctomycetota bacterium]